MKKTVATMILLLIFLPITRYGIQFRLVNANPYTHDSVPLDAHTGPPRISVFAPSNNAIYNETYIPLVVNVSLPQSTTAESTTLLYVDYKADWLEDKIFLYYCWNVSTDGLIASYNADSEFHSLHYSGNLSNVPRGNHNITFHVLGGGSYPRQGQYIHEFSVNSSLTVFFTAGSQYPLNVSLFSIDNKTYDRTDIPLSYAIGEPASRVTYVLDNQNNITINGNTSLSGLPVGPHNITVYAWDLAGFDGHSETVTFTIAEPLPILQVAVPTIVIAVVSAGLFLLVHFKKRKERKQSKEKLSQVFSHSINVVLSPLLTPNTMSSMVNVYSTLCFVQSGSVGLC